MTHVHQRLQAYLDGELAPSAARAVEDHVRQCADCRAELEATRAAWLAVDAATRPGLSRSVWPELAARLEERRAAGPWTWTQRGLAAAAAVAGLVVGLNLGGPAATGVVASEPSVVAAEADYLETSLPSLDQSWLLVADRDEDAGS